MTQLVDLLERYFNRSMYSRTYKDVVQSKVDPLQHYLTAGSHQDRLPNEIFDPTWYRARFALEPSDNPLVHYVSYGAAQGYPVNPVMDRSYVSDAYRLDEDVDPVAYLLMNDVDRVSFWFSRADYLAENPDVAATELAPELHFYRFGLKEGRRIGPGVTVEPLDEPGSFGRTIAEVDIDGTLYRVVRRRLSDTVVGQIQAQALIDPDVVAVGNDCIPYIWGVRGGDLDRRDLINYQSLLSAIGPANDAIIFLPRLQIGGAEKFAANLVEGLRALGHNSITVATTDSWPADDRAAMDLEVLSGMRGAYLVALHESLRRTWKPDMVLALLLLASKPKYVFVVNSDPALRAVANYGAALSSVSKVFCTFFSESPLGQGAPYSVRYMRSVLPHASILSDNRRALDTWNDRTSGIAADKFLKLGPLVSIPKKREYEANVLARLERMRAAGPTRLLWYSRREPFKAPEILDRITQLQPDITIDAFGPVKAGTPGPTTPNVRLRGPVRSPSALRLSSYDAFIFTSRFEGMPNVVLEMAAMGIPIVASDVGGLSETFRSGEVALVSMQGTVTEIAERFVAAIADIRARSEEAMREVLNNARSAVERRHGRETFLADLAALL